LLRKDRALAKPGTLVLPQKAMAIFSKREDK